ncbi:MAG: class I SAM-dependent methyltransferase [Pseudonocardiaceae bacterium]
MTNSVLSQAADLAYRFGLGPRPSDTPDHRLVELVEGPDRLIPGRALDLGCATGRNVLYLARHGWDTTGVEISGQALRIAERKAAGLPVRLVHGDVTQLCALGIGDGYSLVMDGGCYHMVPPSRRDAYARGVTTVAAPGALLIIVGFTSHLGFELSEAELRTRFPGWELLTTDRVPGEQMRQYVSGPTALRMMLGKGWFRPTRFELRRLPQPN